MQRKRTPYYQGGVTIFKNERKKECLVYGGIKIRIVSKFSAETVLTIRYHSKICIILIENTKIQFVSL
jgi:hypothetical protein